MDSLLDAEFRDQDVERSVQNTHNLGLTDDRAIAGSKIGDEDTKVQVSRLLLREGSRVAFAVVKRLG
jgi:hypothetical protein